MAYTAVGITKEDDNVVFSFLRRQFFTCDQAEALERNLLSALGARRGRSFYAANRFRGGNAERNVKCPTRDDTNSQRPTHFQALSDE